MGEEWGEQQPFYYFTDFAGELATAVRDGRREEFRKWPQFADPTNREKIPDPNQSATAQASRPDWSNAGTKRGVQRLQFVRSLLSIRSERLVKYFSALQRGASAARVVAPLAFSVTWTCGDLGEATLYANLGQSPVVHVPASQTGEAVYESRAGVAGDLLTGTLPARSVAFLLDERRA
jgi:1,4-alpha-glucan branching enzyme